MPLDPGFAGREYPPTEPYEVGREKIREFADAVGAASAAHRDPAAARALGYPDVIAPPTFPIVLSLDAADQVVRDPALGLDWSRVVHGGQRFVAERPVRAGDRLRVVVHVDDVRAAAGNDILTLRGEVATVDGEPVCTSYTTLVARGSET